MPGVGFPFSLLCSKEPGLAGSGQQPISGLLRLIWNGLMQTLLVFAELVIAVALIIFVLLQRSEGGALGMGGGGSGLGGLFSPRGAADTLTRTTAILAALFFLTCVGLTL